MNLRRISEILVPSIVITAVIVLIVANQTAQSASINQASNTNEKLVVDQQSETASLTLAPIAADAQLTSQSSIEEIQQALQSAHLRYNTLHLVMITEEMNGDISTDEVWLSQPLRSFRHTKTLNFSGEVPAKFVTVSDGIFTNMFIPEAGRNALVPANTDQGSLSTVESAPSDVPVIVPNWFESRAPTVGLLIMPGDFARIEIANSNSDVSILGEDVYLDRSTVMLRILSPEAGGYNLWVDASTGIILRAERIAFDGVITYSFTITQLEINPDIDSTMFYVDHTAYDPQLLNDLRPPGG